MVQVPDVSNILPSTWAHAVPAVGRDPVRLLRRARDSARRCGSSSSRATRTTRSGSAASGRRRQMSRRSPWPGRPVPGLQQIVVQTVEPEHAADQRQPGPGRGHPAQVVGRRAHLVVRRRHHDQQRPGRGHHHDRAGRSPSTKAPWRSPEHARLPHPAGRHGQVRARRRGRGDGAEPGRLRSAASPRP